MGLIVTQEIIAHRIHVKIRENVKIKMEVLNVHAHQVLQEKDVKTAMHVYQIHARMQENVHHQE